MSTDLYLSRRDKEYLKYSSYIPNDTISVKGVKTPSKNSGENYLKYEQNRYKSLATIIRIVIKKGLSRYFCQLKLIKAEDNSISMSRINEELIEI